MSADPLKHSGDRMLSVLRMTGLTPTEKNVLAVLAWHDGPGGCHPSIERLAGLLRTNRYAVADHLNSLKKKGRVDWKRWQSTNNYTIYYDNLTVGESPTVKENLTVGESPQLTVGESPTRTGIEPELLPPPASPPQAGGSGELEKTTGKTRYT